MWQSNPHRLQHHQVWPDNFLTNTGSWFAVVVPGSSSIIDQAIPALDHLPLCTSKAKAGVTGLKEVRKKADKQPESWPNQSIGGGGPSVWIEEKTIEILLASWLHEFCSVQSVVLIDCDCFFLFPLWPIIFMYVYLVSIELITFIQSFSEKRLTIKCVNCLVSRQKFLQLLMKNCPNVSILHGCIGRRQYTVECTQKPFRLKILIRRIKIRNNVCFRRLATDATCSNEDAPLESLAPKNQAFRIFSTSCLAWCVCHLNIVTNSIKSFLF